MLRNGVRINIEDVLLSVPSGEVRLFPVSIVWIPMPWMLNDLRGSPPHRWFPCESLSNIPGLSNHNGLENDGNRSRSRLVALFRRNIAGSSPLIWSYPAVVQYADRPYCRPSRWDSRRTELGVLDLLSVVDHFRRAGDFSFPPERLYRRYAPYDLPSVLVEEHLLTSA